MTDGIPVERGVASPQARDGPPAATPQSLVRLAVALCLLGCACLPIDLAVARWVAARRLPGEVGRLLDISEAFAQGWGVAGILLVALTLDERLWHRPAGRQPGGDTAVDRPGRGIPAFAWTGLRPREACMRLVAMAVIGGLLVDVVKLVVRRVRPRAIDLQAATDALATFDTTLVGIPHPGSADLLSFPSGHAAAAAGLAAALSHRYPRGAVLFVAFATLAALQRVSSSAHYPSDICFGAAVGCVGAALPLWLGRRGSPTTPGPGVPAG